MGYKCNVTAVSRGIPREDIWAHPAGDADAAAAAVQRFFTDLYPTGETMDALQGFFPGHGHVTVATWGDTVVFGALDDDEHVSRLWNGLQSDEVGWSLIVHSVVDLCSIEAHGPGYDRTYLAWADIPPEEATDHMSGTPLPFERPFLQGAHDFPPEELEDPSFTYPYPYHPLELAAAANVWIFGLEAETPPKDEVLSELLPIAREHEHVWSSPMYVFAAE